VSLVETAIARLRQANAAPGGIDAPKRTTADTGGSTGPHADLEPARQVVEINLVALRAAGYLPDEACQRQFADQYREIKRPLIEKALAGKLVEGLDPRIIMVTSALPGDGKTFTSVNLALSIARERDLSVLLVDADIPKPHVSGIFGLTALPGLTDALLDGTQRVETLVLPTDIRGLSLLPAGRTVEGGEELFASARMRQVLASLLASHPRRLVLLDSSPLLITSESRTLMSTAGQVVMVAREGQTPLTAIRDAVAYCSPEQSGGIVLNQSTASMEGYYGYYGARTYGADRDDRPAES
jgi:exopolysaccharide/PEP-CTERM locus tyrosine autokinase